jgi:Icc-related predicted phosphoesterase
LLGGDVLSKGDLRLGKTESELVEFFNEEQPALVKQSDVIAEILEFAQVLRCDQRCHPVVGHLSRENAFQVLAHDGVETVERFVHQEKPRFRRDRKDEGGLAVHTL